MIPTLDLPRLSIPTKVMLTTFLTLIGTGYLSALANIHHRHHLADGKPGLSLDDLRAVYSGLAHLPGRGESETPSRMLTMIRGEMRQYFSSDSDFTVLESWLLKGGHQEAMDSGEGRRTPRKIIVRDCLRCHGQSTGSTISKQSPFGPDEFGVDYARLSRFLPAGTADGATTNRAAPQYTIERLVLVTHIHMLSIPLFTLIVAVLFGQARFATRLRGLILPLPMLSLVMDFAGWWIARSWLTGIWLIWVGGAVYGTTFGLQLIVTAVDLWRPATSPTA